MCQAYAMKHAQPVYNADWYIQTDWENNMFLEIVMDYLKAPVPSEMYSLWLAAILVCGTGFSLFAFLLIGKNPGDAMWRRSHAFAEHGIYSAYMKLVIFNGGEELIFRGGLEIVQWHVSDWEVIGAALILSAISGFFMPPHNEFPIKMRFAVWFGGFILSLVFLKSGGGDGTGKIPVMPLLFVIAGHVCATTVIATAFAWHYRRELGVTDYFQRLKNRLERVKRTLRV